MVVWLAAVLALPQRLRRGHVVLPRRQDGARLDRHEALMRNGGSGGKQGADDGEAPSESDHVALVHTAASE
jgi:hypothetical protein